MNTKQIIDEQMRELEKRISIYPDGAESFEQFDMEPEDIRVFIHSYTRKLIESLAEDIIGKMEKEERILKKGVDYDVHKVLDFGMEIERVSGKNQLRAEQRLKVKEIINSLEK